MDGHDQDPFAILRRHNPVDPAAVPGPDSPAAQRIYRRVINTPPGRRPVRRLAVRVAAVVLVSLSVAAGGVLVYREVTQPAGVVCYASVSLDSDRVVVDPQDSPDPSLCRAVWAQGPLADQADPPGSVPPLQACVNQEGTFVVFPSDDPAVCQRLGLATPAPSDDQLRSVQEVQRELVAYIEGNRCPTIDDAAAHAQELLDDAGLVDWTVERRPPTGERPCASISIDPDTNTIIVVPIPEAP